MAVDGRHQGEGLLNLLVLHLTEYQMERGRTRLFVCTKTGAAPFFKDLGFYEVAQALGRAAFLENRKNGFANYIKKLQEETRRAFPEGAAKGRGETAFEAGAVVMNDNPFTKGHLYLASQAASRCGILHIFVVEEERSLIPFSVRWDLVRRGTAHLQEAAGKMMGEYFASKFADRISEYAVRALLYEVAVSPKPGLVDRFNQGSPQGYGFLFLPGQRSGPWTAFSEYGQDRYGYGGGYP